MERSVQHRDFSQTVPVRCGFLRFPPVAPNAIKQKGLLTKAAEYVNKKAKPQLTLLLKITIKQETNEDQLNAKYKEEKFLWTWDNDVASEIDSFLKKKAEGMCRHTRKNLGKEKERLLGRHLGICERQECEVLTTEELLMTYLRQPLNSTERHAVYVDFLSSYAPKEFVLFDPEDVQLKCGKVLVGGIHTKTVRHLGNSNGTKLNVFSVLFQASSKLEAAKNFVRPVLLRSKRASTSREFILCYLGHHDKDALTEWWKAITTCVRGMAGDDWNASIKDAYAEEVSDLGRNHAVGAKVLPFTVDSPSINNVILSGDPRTQLDIGRGYEVLTADMGSHIPLEQLFNYVIKQKNYFEEEGSSFERFIFGSMGDAKPEEEVEGLRICVEPINGWEVTNEKYGNCTQTALVRAVTDGKIDHSNWVEGLLPFSKKVQEWSFMKGVTDLFSSIGLGNTNEDSVKENSVSKLRRFFNLNKEYFVDYNNKSDPKKVTGFTVIWSSAQELKNINADGCLKLEKDGASTFELAQLLLKFEAVQSTETFCGETAESFNEMVLKRPGAVKQFLASEEVEQVMRKIKPSKFTIWKNTDSEWIQHRKELVTEMLAKGTKDAARLSILRLLFYLVKESLFMKDCPVESMGDLIFEIVATTHQTLVGCTNIVLLTAGFKVYKELMMFHRNQKLSDFRALMLNSSKEAETERKVRGLIVNEATLSFIASVEALLSDMTPRLLNFEVLRLATGVAKDVLSMNNVCITTANLNLVEWLKALLVKQEQKLSLASGHSRKTFTNKLAQVKQVFFDLEVKWFNACSVVNENKQAVVLDKINKAAAEDSLSKLDGIKAPYVAKRATEDEVKAEWKEATYDAKTNKFIIGENKYQVTLENFKKNKIVVPQETYAPFYFNTSTCIAPQGEHKKSAEATSSAPRTARAEKKALGAKDSSTSINIVLNKTKDFITRVVNTEEASALAMSQLISGSVILGDERRKLVEATKKFSEDAIETLSEIHELLSYVPQTKVSVRVCANPAKLFGQALISKRESLRTEWGKTVLHGLEDGLGMLYYDAFVEDKEITYGMNKSLTPMPASDFERLYG